MRALIITDDQKAARFLARGLRERRFCVDIAHSGDEGDEMASVTNYDVIVLDRFLPDKDGVVVCRDLRERGVVTPILILSAAGTLEDRVTSLNAGADDYLVKPFGFSELLARIHAILRRSELTRPVVLTVANLALEPASRRVAWGGVPINFTGKEYAILEVLMRHPGEIVERAQFCEHRRRRRYLFHRPCGSPAREPCAQQDLSGRPDFRTPRISRARIPRPFPWTRCRSSWKPQSYRYYCPSANAYYPTVRTCPEVSIKVPPRQGAAHTHNQQERTS